MNSAATRRFWDLFHALPTEVQNLAVKNYHLWRHNPNHPWLRFRRLRGSEDRLSVRVGDRDRAIGKLVVCVRNPDGFGTTVAQPFWAAAAFQAALRTLQMLATAAQKG